MAATPRSHESTLSRRLKPRLPRAVCPSVPCCLNCAPIAGLGSRDEHPKTPLHLPAEQDGLQQTLEGLVLRPIRFLRLWRTTGHIYAKIYVARGPRSSTQGNTYVGRSFVRENEKKKRFVIYFLKTTGGTSCFFLRSTGTSFFFRAKTTLKTGSQAALTLSSYVPRSARA